MGLHGIAVTQFFPSSFISCWATHGRKWKIKNNVEPTCNPLESSFSFLMCTTEAHICSLNIWTLCGASSMSDDLGHPESSLPNSHKMVHIKSWHNCIGMIHMAPQNVQLLFSSLFLLRDAFCGCISG